MTKTPDWDRVLSRMEAEAGCELPPLDHVAGGPSLADRARRLLGCDDPPTGEGRLICEMIAGGSR